MKDVWPVVHAERASLITFLESLDDKRWEVPSLCDGWTVHDVVAHLIASAKTTRIGFALGMAKARFDFDRDNATGVARERGSTPAETLAGLRKVQHLTATPPAPLDTRLVEAIVHGEDIRRPLGATGDYPAHAVERALRLQVKTSRSFGGGKELAAGLALVGTNSDLVIGDGPQVRGAAIDLLLVVSGRRVALANLDGPGLGQFAEH